MELLLLEAFSAGSPVHSFIEPRTNISSSSNVEFFVIQGLPDIGHLRSVFFVFLLLSYIFILGGNSMIIFVVFTDPKLKSPMFFFFSHLSLVDILYTSTTIPYMLNGLLTGVSHMSVQGCFAQTFFFILLAVTSRAILTVMAFDRYLAICHPLRYKALMTHSLQVLLLVSCLAFGMFCTLPANAMAWQRHYCSNNVVQHAWCDPSTVRRLVCGDTLVDNIVSLSFALVALLSTGLLILTSYILIGLSVCAMGSAQRLKAFGTCAAHLTVVTISYTAASCVYISYRVAKFPPEARIMVAVLYAALTPFLNPLIYSLRNKELGDSIRGRLSRFRAAAACAARGVPTKPSAL